MTLLETALSLGAILAASRTTTTGNIFYEDDNVIEVTSCSPESVTINHVVTTDNNGNHTPILEAGSILVYLGGNNDNSICTNCSPLFRKLVSKGDGSNTYNTTYATFGDIFPDDVYDQLLENTLVEPKFECPHSWQSSSSNNQSNRSKNSSRSREQQEHRNLQTSPCAVLAIPISIALIIAYICPICCFVVMPTLILATLIVTAIEATGTPVCRSPVAGWLGVDGERDGLVFQELFSQNDKEEESLQGKRRQDEEEESTTVFFPTGSRIQEWTKTDTNGNCLYVDCNVGSPTASFTNAAMPHSCYHGGSLEDLCADHNNNFTNEFHKNEFIFLPEIKTTDNSDFNFDEPCCIQNYCYSSNKFHKSVCDENFYKSMKQSCPFHHHHQQQQQQLVSLSSSTIMMDSSTTTTFPLSGLELSQNCQMMALLYYLGAKIFGFHAYQTLQSQQREYEETICKQPEVDTHEVRL